MSLLRIPLLLLSLTLVGCAGKMLPGRIYAAETGRTIQFQIQTSYGNGKMSAADPQTGEVFEGEYSGTTTGQAAVFGNIGNESVTLIQPPTGANARGILVGDKGTTIRIYFEIKPGLRPTGHGVGQDQDGNEYEVFF